MKKTIALLLVLVFCFSLAACGTSTGGTPATAASSAAPASTATATTAPSTDTAPAAPEVLKIGVLANLTGWFATIDSNNVNEVKTVAQMINDAGGLKVGDKTYTIELDIQDGQSDATGIRNAAQILANDGVKYVIETNDFWVEGALDIFEKAGIMNIEAMNNMDFKALGPDLKYAYTFCNGAAAQYGSAIQALVKNYPDVKSVVYVQSDDGNNAIGEKLVADLCAKNGLTYVDKPVLFDGNTTDWAAVALQVVNTGADALVGNFTPPAAGGMLKEIRNSGSDMVFACVMGLSANMLVGIAGPEAATNAFTMGADLTSEKNNTEAFWKIFTQVKATYGEEAAGAFTGNFANCLYVLSNLLEGAGSAEVKDVQAYWDTLTTVDTIYGTGKIGGMELYGINHLIAMPDPISMAQDGKVSFGGWFDTEVK